MGAGGGANWASTSCRACIRSRRSCSSTGNSSKSWASTPMSAVVTRRVVSHLSIRRLTCLWERLFGRRLSRISCQKRTSSSRSDTDVFDVMVAERVGVLLREEIGM